jgi:hypothetical protein
MSPDGSSEGLSANKVNCLIVYETNCKALKWGPLVFQYCKERNFFTLDLLRIVIKEKGFSGQKENG